MMSQKCISTMRVGSVSFFKDISRSIAAGLFGVSDKASFNEK